MKTVKFLSLILVSSIILFSCKHSEKSDSLDKKEATTNMAMTDNASIDEASSVSESTYLYVSASTGLSLREYANLQSEKLAIMPYGTKIKVITTETNPTMNIRGIKGGMDQIEFNHKKGFAFNGYLSRFFPPEMDISPKGYAQELKKLFPEVIYTEISGGSASAPTNTETIILPTEKWHEAYFIAQNLFDFPGEFSFPKPKGKDLQIIKDSKPKRNVWVSELIISRKENTLQKIEYVYKTKGFSSTVTISKDGNTMKLSKTEEVK
jgi:hypothetical protein